MKASEEYRLLKWKSIGPHVEDGFDTFIMPLLDLLQELTHRVIALEARLGESQTSPTPE